MITSQKILDANLQGNWVNCQYVMSVCNLVDYWIRYFEFCKSRCGFMIRSKDFHKNQKNCMKIFAIFWIFYFGNLTADSSFKNKKTVGNDIRKNRTFWHTWVMIQTFSISNQSWTAAVMLDPSLNFQKDRSAKENRHVYLQFKPRKKFFEWTEFLTEGVFDLTENTLYREGGRRGEEGKEGERGRERR